MLKITVIGTGYVGLVTGTCLAETGHDVWCIDVDPKKIQSLNDGIIPIYEPGLQEILDRNVEKNRLHFSCDLRTSARNSDVIFIAVGTPPGADGRTNMDYIDSACDDIASVIHQYTVIVNKSTVPIGTGQYVNDRIKQRLADDGRSISFDVVSNPEFLKEGSSVNDFLKPARIIIGCNSDRARQIMKRIYQPFVISGHPIIFMDIQSAELTKYAANAMLATRISFMNDMATICEKVGADINLIRKGIGSDPRIGSGFLYAGIGYGGSCFPKDILAMIQTGNDLGHPLKILQAVDEVNEHQKRRMVDKVCTYFNNEMSGKQIAVWGLSFKPRTDDIRKAPALESIDRLLQLGCSVKAYDPVAMDNVRSVFNDRIVLCDDQYDVLDGSDCLIVFTEWAEFRSPDFRRIESSLKYPVIFDGRNIYHSSDLKEYGLIYFGIGIPQPQINTTNG